MDQPTYEKLFLTKNTCIVSTKVVKKEDELIWVPCGCGGGETLEEDLGRRAPRQARLQFARRPLITRVAESSQAFLAASASLKVTFYIFTTRYSN